jgi:tetratricopeptide (TPR) repeat protein
MELEPEAEGDPSEADPDPEDPFSYDDLVPDDGPATQARIPLPNFPAPNVSIKSIAPLSSPRPSWPPVPDRAAFAGGGGGGGSAGAVVIPPPPAPPSGVGLAAPPHDLSGSFTDTRTWTLRAEAFLDQIDRARSREQRVRLYRELAEMLEHRLDDPQQAFDVLVAALGEDVDDDDTARALERVARKTERFAELIQLANGWLEEPETKGDLRRTLGLSLRVAKWYGEDVDRPEWALPYLERAQALAPRDVRPFRILARIRRRQGDVDRAGATLMSALELATTDKDRKEIHVEIGELLWKYKGQPEQALASYERALDVDPGWLPAIDALETLFRERGQLAPVAELLERKLALAESGGAAGSGGDSDVSGTRVRLAQLYSGALGQPERAMKLLEQVLRDDPRNAAAHRELADHYRAQGNAQGLRAALERRLDAAATAREQLELLSELAQLLEHTFMETELAVYRLEQALAVAPEDEPTLEALTRLYGRQRRWADVAAMLEQHAMVARAPAKRAELYVALARTLERELGDSTRALEAWTAAAELEPDHPEAAAALVRLDVRSADPEAAIQRLRRAAVRAADPAQRANAHQALGLALQDAGDETGAREAFLDALDHDPDHLPSITALRRTAVEMGDDRGAVRWLEREVALTTKPRLRAQLLAKLGTLRAEAGDAEAGRAAWEEAIAIDGDVDEALRPLAEACVVSGDFARAEPMLAKLRARAATADDARKLAALHGRALSGLGRDDAAARVLGEAQRLAPGDPEVLDALADATWKAASARGDWPAALEAHQRLLETLDDDARRLEVLHRVAVIQRALGKSRAAIATLDHVLASAPDHRPSLETLAAIYEEQQDWQGYVDAQRQLADSAKEPDDRLAALDAIADAWWKRVGDAGQAIAALEEALAERPTDLPRLHRVLAIGEASQDWPRVLDTLGRVVAIEANPQRRAKYVFTMGQLLRDAMNDPDRALACFERALDDDPHELRAFESIDRLLTSLHDWKRLERAYRKMLHRVAERPERGTDVEHHLWSGLGLIYRDRLHDEAAAVEAFRMAAQLRPDDPRTRRILADLHERGGRAGDAAMELQQVIAKEPRRAEPYRQLYRLYRRQGAFDRAWCVAAALSFLQQADAEQQQYLAQLATEAPIEPTRALDLSGFATLFPREHDVVLGKLFELLVPALRAARLIRLQAEGRLAEPPPASIQDPATSRVPIVHDLAVAAAVLGLPLPRPSARPDLAGGLAPLLVDPPATLIGAGVLGVASAHERRFLAGRHMAAYRPELYVTTLVGGPSELKALSLSALQLSQVDVPMPEDLARVAAETSRELARYLQPVQQEALRKVMRRFVERGGQADAKAFWKTADRIALRFGLLLCGDVAAAGRACAGEPVGPHDPSPTQRLEDLLAWSVSEEHFALRDTIGIKVAG